MKIKNATFAYKNAHNVFKDINIALEKGEILSIMGSNGIGKTTLIKCIAGILKFTKGTVEFNKNARVSYVPQTKYINLSYNVLDFVSFGRNGLNPYFSSPSELDYEISRKIIQKLDMVHIMDKNINEISGGELQMCYIAKSLASEPDILILDEAESNLDFKNQRKIMLLIKELANNGMIIILNTHYLNYAAEISNKVLLMTKKNYRFGLKNEILNKENLEECFDVPIRKININNKSCNYFMDL